MVVGGAPNIPAQHHPRKFHEMFMLRAAEQGEGSQPKVCFLRIQFLKTATADVMY